MLEGVDLVELVSEVHDGVAVEVVRLVHDVLLEVQQEALLGCACSHEAEAPHEDHDLAERAARLEAHLQHAVPELDALLEVLNGVQQRRYAHQVAHLQVVRVLGRALLEYAEQPLRRDFALDDVD